MNILNLKPMYIIIEKSWEVSLLYIKFQEQLVIVMDILNCIILLNHSIK